MLDWTNDAQGGSAQKKGGRPEVPAESIPWRESAQKEPLGVRQQRVPDLDHVAAPAHVEAGLDQSLWREMGDAEDLGPIEALHGTRPLVPGVALGVDVHAATLAAMKTASKLEWLQSRPDKFKETPEGQAALRTLETIVGATPKIDPLTPWLWREIKKGRLVFERGETPNGLPSSQLLTAEGQNVRVNDLSHIADWFASGNQNPTRRGVDLMQLSYPEMTQRIQQWDQYLQQQAEQANMAKAAGGEVVHQWPDGWTVRKLGPEHLDFEGDCMGHCIGGHGYADAVRRGDKQIYSLRDPNHMPHVTMELDPGDRRPEFTRNYMQRGLETAFTHDSLARTYPEPVKEAMREFVATGGTVSPELLADPVLQRNGWDLQNIAYNAQSLYKKYMPHSHDGPEGGTIVQIQGKGNEVPKPEYQQRMKDWFQTIPEDQRPNWEDNQGDIEHIGGIYPEAETYNSSWDGVVQGEPDDEGGMGGYGLHGDYGLVTPPRDINYHRVLDSLIRPQSYGEWKDKSSQTHDDHEVAALYKAALERGQIPQLAQASEKYQEGATNDYDDLEDQNYDYFGPWPGEDVEEFKEQHPDGIPNGDEWGRHYTPETPEEWEQAFNEATERYNLDRKELHDQHAPSQLVNSLYNYLRPHYGPNGYTNEIIVPEGYQHNVQQTPLYLLPPGTQFHTGWGGVHAPYTLANNRPVKVVNNEGQHEPHWENNDVPAHIAVPQQEQPGTFSSRRLSGERGVYYHVAPAHARESIMQHGLVGHGRDGLTESPWAHADWKWRHLQPHGNYLFDTPQAAHGYIQALHSRDDTPRPQHEDWHDYHNILAPHSDDDYDYNPDAQAHIWDEWGEDEDEPNYEPYNHEIHRPRLPPELQGYDIWRAHLDPDRHQILNDPEPILRERHQFDNPEADISTAEALHNFRQDTDEDGWYNGDSAELRWYTPNHIEPERLQLETHVPHWQVPQYPDAPGWPTEDSSEYEVPEPFTRIPQQRYFGAWEDEDGWTDDIDSYLQHYEEVYPWSRGHHGKFLITPEGNFRSWQTDDMGGPHHDDVAQRWGLTDYVLKGDISPSGTWWITDQMDPDVDPTELMHQAEPQAEKLGLHRDMSYVASAIDPDLLMIAWKAYQSDGPQAQQEQAIMQHMAELGKPISPEQATDAMMAAMDMWFKGESEGGALEGPHWHEAIGDLASLQDPQRQQVMQDVNRRTLNAPRRQGNKTAVKSEICDRCLKPYMECECGPGGDWADDPVKDPVRDLRPTYGSFDRIIPSHRWR